MGLLAWFGIAFVVGAVVGNLINRCVDRLPYEKSLWWPGARCPVSLQPLPWYDQIPIVSYLILGGRYRGSQAPIPLRQFAVELGTALAFVGLLFFVAVYERDALARMRIGRTERQAVWIAFHYAVLFSLLLTASLCDLREMEIPLSVTIPGTLIGLGLSTLAPWPLPGKIPEFLPRGMLDQPGFVPPMVGSLHPWPVWYPLPDWLPPGSWQLGFCTALAGAAAGMLILRIVAFLFKMGRGIEGLGIGDADLMMMVGAFVGWQPVVLSFFVAVLPALVFAVLQVIFKGDHPLPFGPSLALGSMITLLGWLWIGPRFGVLFFDPLVLGLLGGAGAIILLVASLLLRLRGMAHE